MTYLRCAFILLLLTESGFSYTDSCRIDITANDLMQFNQRELSVASDCTEVELTLKHVGSQPAKVMGHNWVLAKTRDVPSLANEGAAAGFTHDFQPTGDARILAATRIVGGGESTTIKFPTATLQKDENYSFFCSAPGHYGVMKGRFKFGGDADRVASRSVK